MVTEASPGTTAATVAGSFAENVDMGDGRSIYLECQGTGSPTVILQSGYGNAADIWSLSDTTSPAVFPALAETNRVCRYDRPGSLITTTDAGGKVTSAETPRRSRSDAVPMPRDPADVVTELHDLLAAAHIPGPYVLAGHSMGGALDVLYALTYPDEVSGVVAIDAPLPPYRDLLGDGWTQAVAVGKLDPSLASGYELESYDNGLLFDEITAGGPLPDIPVVVVRRGAPPLSDEPLPEGSPISPAEVDAINNAQWNGQQVWADSAPGAVVITVPDTTHYVQNQRPDAVVEAIRQAIEGS